MLASFGVAALSVIIRVAADNIGYSFIDTDVCLCVHDKTQSVYWCNPLDDDVVYQFSQTSSGECVGDTSGDHVCTCALSLEAAVNGRLQSQAIQQPNITYELYGTSLYGCGELVVDPNSEDGGGDGHQASYYPQATSVPSSGGSSDSGGGSSIPSSDEDDSTLTPDISDTTPVATDYDPTDYNNPYNDTYDGGEIEGDEDDRILDKRQVQPISKRDFARRADGFRVERIARQAEAEDTMSSAIPTTCLLVATSVTASDTASSTANDVAGNGQVPVSCTSVYDAFDSSLSICAAESTSIEANCGCALFTGSLGSAYLACATAAGDTDAAASITAVIPDCSSLATPAAAAGGGGVATTSTQQAAAVTSRSSSPLTTLVAQNTAPAATQLTQGTTTSVMTTASPQTVPMVASDGYVVNVGMSALLNIFGVSAFVLELF